MIEVIKTKGNAVLIYTSGVYRKASAQLHHLFPKSEADAMREFFKKAGIDIDEFLMVFDETTHSKLFHTNRVIEGVDGPTNWLSEWIKRKDQYGDVIKESYRPIMIEELIDLMGRFKVLPEGANITTEAQLKNFIGKWNENMIKFSKYELDEGQEIVQQMKNWQLIPDNGTIQTQKDVLDYFNSIP